jgi:VWA domain-containing protein
VAAGIRRASSGAQYLWTGVQQDCPGERARPQTSHQISPLDPQRFSARLGGSTLAITAIEKIQSPRILLMVDVSGSLDPDMKFVRGVVEDLIQHVPPGASLAYGFFSDTPMFSDGFTSDPQKLSMALTQLNGFQAVGHTALYDALHKGLELFHGVNPGDSILLITDGGDNSSKTTENHVRRELREAGVRIFTILLNHSTAAPPEEEDGPRTISDLTDDTGGTFFSVTRTERWSDTKWRASVLNDLRIFWSEGVASGYLLTLQIPAGMKEARRWKLQIHKSGDNRLKNATILFPEKLMPCSANSAAAH